MAPFMFLFNERNKNLGISLGPGYVANIDFSQFPPDMFPDDWQLVGDHELFNQPTHIIPGKKLVLLKGEPEAVIHVREWMIDNMHMFHKVYTFDADLLKFFPEKTVKWVNNCGCNMEESFIKSYDPSQKEFKISFWRSANGIRGCWGHLLRHDTFAYQKHFPEKCVFFRSSRLLTPKYLANPVFDENKNILFEKFQFGVTIENSRQTNYFTSKLTDCLVTKTIPIYWGCPNISEYFDTTGWIFFEDVSDLLDKINALTPEYYSRYTEVIDKNYHEALKYCDFYSNLERQHYEAMNK